MLWPIARLALRRLQTTATCIGKTTLPRAPSLRSFDVLCLRENRRVVKDEARREELENFHEILNDISHGSATASVRGFITQCFDRGAEIRTAGNVPFEEHTAIFSRRRDRDKWNRTVVRRIATQHNHQTVELQNRCNSVCVCGSVSERLMISHVAEENSKGERKCQISFLKAVL